MLAKYIPDDCIVVSESGIVSHDDMKNVRQNGVDAVLIGETLMRSGDISETMKQLREGI